jgi:hypothetical protein
MTLFRYPVMRDAFARRRGNIILGLQPTPKPTTPGREKNDGQAWKPTGYLFQYTHMHDTRIIIDQ